MTVVDRGRWTLRARRRPDRPRGHRDAGPRAGPHADRRRRPGRARRRPVRRAGHARPHRARRRAHAPCCAAPPTTPTPSSGWWSPTPSSSSSSPRWPTRCRARASSTAAWSRRTRVASTPVLCLTKADLADPSRSRRSTASWSCRSSSRRRDRPPDALPSCSTGGSRRWSGIRGWGSPRWSTARPGRGAGHGVVSAVGKGRHTTVAAIALPLPDGRGWVVDTPGVRSFGLAHVTPDDVPAAFDDLAAAIEDCPRGCGHLGPPADPECALDVLVAEGKLRPARLAALRRVLGRARLIRRGILPAGRPGRCTDDRRRSTGGAGNSASATTSATRRWWRSTATSRRAAGRRGVRRAVGRRGGRHHGGELEGLLSDLPEPHSGASGMVPAPVAAAAAEMPVIRAKAGAGRPVRGFLRPPRGYGRDPVRGLGAVLHDRRRWRFLLTGVVLYGGRHGQATTATAARRLAADGGTADRPSTAEADPGAIGDREVGQRLSEPSTGGGGGGEPGVEVAARPGSVTRAAAPRRPPCAAPTAVARSSRSVCAQRSSVAGDHGDHARGEPSLAVLATSRAGSPRRPTTCRTPSRRGPARSRTRSCPRASRRPTAPSRCGGSRSRCPGRCRCGRRSGVELLRKGFEGDVVAVGGR